MVRRFVLVALLLVAGSGIQANAQGEAPSGRGSATGDPAASSATPGTAPARGALTRPNRSGSGTSTSGGSDANGDQGRDKMPESSLAVKPLSKQNKRDKMP